MDGASMPNAKNVVEAAKNLNVSMKTAGEEITKCFNAAILYFCENLKLQDFAKGLDKQIDEFCSETQVKIDKIFKTVEKATQTLNLAVLSLDSIELPKKLIKKTKDLKRLFKKANKIINPLLKFCLKLIVISPIVAMASGAMIPLRNLALRFADTVEALRVVGKISKKVIKRFKKWLLQAPDLIKEFIEKLDDSIGFLFKIYIKMVIGGLAFKRIDALYEWVIQIGKKSVKIFFLGFFIKQGAKIIRKFVNILKDIIDTINEIKAGIKLRFKVWIIDKVLGDIMILGVKCILFLIIALPAILGALALWLFVFVIKKIISYINTRINVTKNTIKKIWGIWLLMNVLLIVAILAIPVGILSLFAALALKGVELMLSKLHDVISYINIHIKITGKTFLCLVAMMGFIVLMLIISIIAAPMLLFAWMAYVGILGATFMMKALSELVKIVNKIKIQWKSLLVLLFLLIFAIMLTTIALTLTIMTLIAAKINLVGMLKILLALGIMLAMTMALGALLSTGWGFAVLVLGLVAVGLVLIITTMVLLIALLASKIDLEGLKKLGKAMGLILAFIKRLNKFKIGLKEIKDLLLVMLAVSILLIAAITIFLISKLSEKIVLAALKNFGEALVIMLTAVKNIREFKIGLKEMKDLLIVMLAISILLIAAIVIFLISKISEKIVLAAMKNFGEALGILLTGITKVREFKIGLDEIKDLLIVMLATTILLIAAIVIFLISKISEKIVLAAMKNFGEALIIMLTAMKRVTESELKITFKTIGQVALILAATIMLTIIGVGLMIMSIVGTKISLDALSQYGAAIGILVGTLSSIGALGPILMPILGMAAGVIGLLTVSILLMVGMAYLLTKFDENIDYKGKAESLIGFFNEMLTSINNIGFGTIAMVMLKIGPLMMVSMGLSFMAHTIASIAKLNIPDEWNEKGKPIHFRQMNDADFELATTNALKVLSTLVEAVSSEEVNNLTGIGLLLAMHNFHKLDIIALQLAFMTKTIASIAMLQIPDEWNENGDPIHFRQLTQTDFDNAVQAAEKIMTCLIDMITDINTEEIIAAADAAEDIFDDIEEIIDPIGKIVDIVCGLATMQVPIAWDDHGRPNDFKILEPEDFVKAGESIRTIVEKFCTSLVVIGTKEIEDAADKAEDIFDDIEEIVDPIAGIVDMTIKLAKGVQIPSKWDEEGKPIEWTKLDDTDYTKAAENISTIVSSFIGMFTDEKLKAAIDNQKVIKNSEDMFKSLNVAINPIKGILDIVQGFAGGKFPTKFNEKGEGTDWVSVAELCNKDGSLSEKGLQIQNSITGLITLTFDAIKNAKLDDSEITKNANLINQLGRATKPLGNMISYYDKLDENKMKHVREFTAENIKWLNRVDNIKVDNVKTVAGLFEQMTEFSRTINGNFEKLADTLNDKLMTVLKELKEILEKASDEIKDYHASGSSSSATNSKKVPEAISSPAKDEKDKNTKKIDLTETNRKISEVTTAINKLYNEISDGSYFKR